MEQKTKKQFLCGPRPLNLTPSNTTVLVEEGPRMQDLSGVPAWDSFQLEERVIKKRVSRTSLVVQWLRTCLLMQGTHVKFLAGELRSHMPRRD